ncbi:hypothetical protein [Cohnella abietis]|uniref:Tyrosine protein kinase n=1 Tax=Cohnella abietis TaxID=2507935 RepID=A0A3T1DC17_9BACL|nr:hypothetical protein [Cohnella abietis]BBI35691.1 hypothetical protein KCTCHS21_50900 [Cohnella abietis]
MDEQHSSSQNGWSSGFFGQDQFPGIEQTIPSSPEVINPTVIPAKTAVTPATKSSLPFNISNLSDIKGIVERMGGIEGVMANLGKFQKFMATMQQIAPMIKLFMGNKGKSADTNKGFTPRKRTPVRRRSGKSRARKPAKRR